MELKTQLPKVGIGRRCGSIQANLDGYRKLMSEEAYEELRTLAKELQGVKVCHVNSTAAGGGVAELLARYVPMLQALGVQADWRLIHGEAGERLGLVGPTGGIQREDDAMVGQEQAVGGNG